MPSSPSQMTAAEFVLASPAPRLPSLHNSLQPDATVRTTFSNSDADNTPRALSAPLPPFPVTSSATRTDKAATVLRRRGRGSTASRESIPSPTLVSGFISSGEVSQAPAGSRPGAETSSWFGEFKGPARVERQMYHAKGKDELPYWLSYSHATTNWSVVSMHEYLAVSNAGT